jgi:hypothetical protein
MRTKQEEGIVADIKTIRLNIGNKAFGSLERIHKIRIPRLLGRLRQTLSRQDISGVIFWQGYEYGS